MNILMTQIGSLGDCLMTTPIARQIKEVDYPGCHLSWLIGDKSDVILRNNPHVDEVIVLPIEYNPASIVQARSNIREYVQKLKNEGRVFDKVFLFDPGVHNQVLINFGTFRKANFITYHDVYGHRMTVSPEPVIVLEPNEVENVRLFMKKHNLDGERDYLIIFESDPKSKQSPITPTMAIEVAQKLVSKFPQVKCILSGKNSSNSQHERIIDANTLTYRENAEMLNHCRLMVGANSGITGLHASTWSKKIPMVQNVRTDYDQAFAMGGMSFSIEMDYKAVGTPTGGLIELQEADVDTLFKCINNIVERTFPEAKKKYPERQTSLTEYTFNHYIISKFGYDTLKILTNCKTPGSVANGQLPNPASLLLCLANTQHSTPRHPVKTGGALIRAAKKAVRHLLAWLLTPICDQQTEFNSATFQLSDCLTNTIGELRNQTQADSKRLLELEQKIKLLEAGQQPDNNRSATYKAISNN